MDSNANNDRRRVSTSLDRAPFGRRATLAPSFSDKNGVMPKPAHPILALSTIREHQGMAIGLASSAPPSLLASTPMSPPRFPARPAFSAYHPSRIHASASGLQPSHAARSSRLPAGQIACSVASTGRIHVIRVAPSRGRGFVGAQQPVS
ncbi:hypothetical protein G6O67_007588 [Ophiocordyceps sinensis]|uniref:Uncharacterized protein n=1 Tax=Ophiocordyceps sinensis TaxID=72228 RepID=A0A8H4LU83_9HYPO|nr:hypothetical protein G6O67_007588 [Ophiocordyceps sinensis]